MKKNIFLIMVISFLIQLGYAQQLEEGTPQSNTTKAQKDVLYTYKSPYTLAACYWNGKVYTTRTNASSFTTIYRFNISGNTLTPDGSVPVDGITMNFLTGFATDGTTIYAVNDARQVIYKINPANWTITHFVVTTGVAYSAIAYDKQNKGLWVAESESATVTLLTSNDEFVYNTEKKTTLTIPLGVTNRKIMGLAYDDVTEGGPYLITAIGAEDDNTATLGRWNIAAKTYEANIKNVANLPGGVETDNYMGSIFNYMVDEKLCLLGVSRGADLVFAYNLTAQVPVCDAPTDVTIPTATITNTTAIVNWTAGGTETAWSVEYKSGANPWEKRDVNGNPTTALTGLNANTEYFVQVKAICDEGESEPTQEIRFTTTSSVEPTYYKITASASGNGTILPTGDTMVLAGATIIFTFTPNEGYVVQALFVDNKSVEPTGNTHTFTNVDANHTIHVDFSIVGVKENAHENSILIYPNPTTGELKIKNWELKINNVEIYDIYGRNVHSFTCSLVHSIDISHLPAGIYFVQIQTEQEIVTKKIIKH